MTTNEGLRLKEQGQELALSAAEEWSARASEWVDTLPTGTVFTSEDLTEAVGLPNTSSSNKNNAVGAKMAGLAKMKLIEVGDFVKTKTSRSHARVIRQWKKL